MQMKIIKRKMLRILSVSMCLVMLYSISGCADPSAVSAQDKKAVTSSSTVTDILDEKTATGDSLEAADDSSETSDAADVGVSDVATENSLITGDDYEPSDVESSETVNESSASSNTDGIDVDLTVLSATAVYGEVYDMMYFPENYVGKSIRMTGIYSDYLDETTGKHYHACIIMDATACCSQGIEFILTDDYKYPDDYPKDADNITVEGIFDIYEENGAKYCTLRDARLM